jgi:hypothetical protein
LQRPERESGGERERGERGREGERELPKRYERKQDFSFYRKKSEIETVSRILI